MSSTDERVVKMRFDNAEFKKEAVATKQAMDNVNQAVDSAGKGKGLLNLSSGIQRVTATASKMAVVTTTALATITNKAVNAGLQLANSLTLDPIRQGFSEYEALLSKQQVIMNATGKSAGQVKKVLTDLNHYSDQTIFSFGDMTEALTSFVNAGVPLKQASQAMQGIANASALAGASTVEAQSSFRAFSQALGQGFLGLQDWRQAAVTGKIGTVQFKQELIDSAVAMGTLTKRGDEYVTKSGKVLTATKNFDLTLQEQWASTEVLNKALRNYADRQTELGKKAFKSAQDVRTFSAFMDTFKESLGSGWSQIFTTIFGGLNKSTKFWTNLSNAVGKASFDMFQFIDTTIKTFKQMDGFENVLAGIQNLLAPFGAILDVIGAAWKAAFPSTGAGSGEALANLAEGFASVTQPLQLVADLIRKLTPFVTDLFSGIASGSNVLGTFVGYLSDLAGALLSIDVPGGGGFLSGLFDGIKEQIGNIAAIGMDLAKNLWVGLTQGFENIDFSATSAIIGTGLLGGIFLALRKFMSGGGFSLFGDGLFESITGAFDTLTDTLSAMQAQIQSKTLMQIAVAIGLITASVVALSLIDSGALTKALGAMAAGFGQLLGAMAILTKISGAAGFVKVPLIAASMVLLAGSITLLTGAIALMSLLSWEQIGKGLTGIAGALVVIAIGMNMMPTTLPLTAAGLVLVGIALNAIGSAMAIMGNLEWNTIGRGLVATAGALVAIALGMQLMPATLPLTAAGLVFVGIALNGIGAALKIMASMSWEEIGKGLATLGGAMAILAIGLNVMSGTLLGSAALLVAAAAIAVLVPPLLLMSKLSWEEIGKGLVALAGGLTVLGIAMTLMSGAILGAAALLIIAPAILALTTAMLALSQLSWEDLGMALAALAAGLTVIGLAGLLIGPVVPALLGLGAALLLLGAGLALAGAGIFLFSTGLGVLVGLGAGAISYLSGFIEAFIDLLPKMGEGFGNMLVEMASAIADRAPEIAESFVKIMDSLIDTAIKMLPKLEQLFNKGLDALVRVVIRNQPKLVAAGLKLMTSFLNTLASNIGGLVEAGANVIIAWLQGVGRETPRIATAAADVVIQFIHDMANAIRTKGPELGAAMGDLGVAMVEGLIGGIGSMFGAALSKIGDLAKGLVGKAKGLLKIFSPSRVFFNIGEFLVMGLTNGIQSNAAAAITAVASMVSGQISVASRYIDGFVQMLDQQAIAAMAKAQGLAMAADKAQQSASKTKSKKDDKRADKLADKASKAQEKADKADEAASRARDAADRAEQFRSSSTIEQAKMRSEDAEMAFDRAKELEASSAAALVAAAALEKQAKGKGVNDKQEKKLKAEAARLRAQAAADAAQANAEIAAARQAASDALALQAKAGAEAAALFQEQFDLEARTAAEEEAFAKLSNAEKAAKRRADAETLQAKAQADLERAKQLAYSDLEAANDLAQQAMDEAQQAREYLKDAAQYEGAGAQGTNGSGGVLGTVVDLSPTEAAALAFNEYSSMYEAATAAAAGSRTIEFNQYNTSPEALSPTEIYRNTHSQFTFALDALDEATAA